MKIVFLDFDGVINNRLDACPTSRQGIRVDPKLVARLNHILEKTEAQVIITSTWRLEGLMPCKEALFLQGLLPKTVRGVTPTPYDMRLDGRRGTRGGEIQAWLDAWSDVEDEGITSYVVLDDVNDGFDFLADRFIQTDGRYGLQDEHCERAIKLLNEV